ncbi:MULTISPECIES: hypothetical protein [unclassified Bradyrhizobium]|uniref:hypothetical protein n=1 Tax=unclassified Bradyrhizobium TaxID=2631580 RepID=UPI002FF0F29B
MKKLSLIAVALLTPCVPAVAAPPKAVKAVTCQGEFAGAHTLVIGNCTFEGTPAGQVYEKCKEDSVCRVQAHGWRNGQGMYIITRVQSVQRIEAGAVTGLSTAELEMARNCKKGKPCSLTCSRAQDAGREDLVRAGACAE